MDYICQYCGFMFYRLGEIVKCPYCESDYIRMLTDYESKILLTKKGEYL
jgi:predicted Zn-ribbon and HTH transcriptional regulator